MVEKRKKIERENLFEPRCYSAVHTKAKFLDRYTPFRPFTNELKHGGKNPFFGRTMHCLPQRLKPTFFEIFSNGAASKGPAE